MSARSVEGSVRVSTWCLISSPSIVSSPSLPRTTASASVDDVTALGVEQEELLLDPDGADARDVSAGERGHGRLVEGRQVVGLAAGDQVAVDDDLLVLPVRAGVAQVGLQARPRGQGRGPGRRRPRPATTARGRSRRRACRRRRRPSRRRRRPRRCAARRGWRRRRAAPGRRTTSASASANVSSTSKVSALSRWLNAWTWPFSTDDEDGLAAGVLARPPRVRSARSARCPPSRRRRRSSCQ